jgi:hypothetical protein
MRVRTVGNLSNVYWSSLICHSQLHSNGLIFNSLWEDHKPDHPAGLIATYQEGYHCEESSGGCFVLSFQCSLYWVFNRCVMLQGAGDTSNFEIVLPNIDRQIFKSVAKNTVNEAIHG